MSRKKSNPKDGLAFLRRAPASGVKFGNPQKLEDPVRNTYLWVIDYRGIPYLIESRMDILDRHLPKHTNLTGGKSAYIGGELWFSDANSILCIRWFRAVSSVERAATRCSNRRIFILQVYRQVIGMEP